MSEIKNGGLDQYGAEPFDLEQLALKGLNKQSVLALKAIDTACA